MIPLFIISNRGYSGKNFIAIGILSKLIELGYNVGYMKPISKTAVKEGKEVFDADAIFIKKSFSLAEPLNIISPFAMSYETQIVQLRDKVKNANKKILDAFYFMKDKDFIVISGPADIFEGSILNIDALSLIKEMQAYVIFVEQWKGVTSMDALYGIQRLVGNRYLGGVFNKVPSNILPYVKDSVKPFMEKKGIKIFGVFPKDKFLESVTIRHIIEALNGGILCGEDKLDELINNFMIGAMDVDNALRYFSRVHDKVVITGANRTDIQLAAIETSTKCIILTGGLYTNEFVLERAQEKGVAIIAVQDDTFTAVDKIETILSRTRIREKGKLEKAKELFNQEFDFKRLIKCFK
ncbi:MAG: phosphotransacetylase family protein [Thermodesulfovibrionales bacterium]|nr:phosphotransacetylase family protein [Thermodesulfovibrionales bacterium]